jgi:subfamily B ATP-binding cassette protein MsbA
VSGASWPVVRRLLGTLAPYRARVAWALVAMAVMAATTGLYPLLLDLLTTLLFRGAEDARALIAPRLQALDAALAQVGLGALDPAWTAAVGGVVERWILALFAAVVVLKTTSQALRFYLMGDLAQRVVLDLRARLFASLLRQEAAFFGRTTTGQLLSRVMNDVGQVEQAATYAIPILVGDVLRVLVLGGVLLWQYPGLSLVTAAVLPLAVFPIVRFGKLLKRYAVRGRDALGELTQVTQESLGGIRVVQTYGGEAHEAERFRREGQRYLEIMRKSVLARATQTPIMELVGVLALVVAIVWAEREVAAGALRPGEVVGFLLAIVLVYEPLKAIGRVSGILVPGLSAAEQVFALVDRVPEIRDPVSPEALATRPSTLCVEHVRFTYPGRDRPALDGVSLTLERGRVVGVAGASGSGKSTLAALLVRLHDPSAGHVRLDGHELRALRLADVRANVAVVAQDTYLFDDTIRANIGYARPGATDAEIEAAARRAFAHEFVTALPEGYATRVGERGARLSGGQRQRIAIARAFLRDAPILVLDEATSALDNEGAREVERALEALMSARATLVIAHRLSALRGVDELLVLEDGKVVERGAPAELERAGGAYARLVAAGALEAPRAEASRAAGRVAEGAS